MSRIFAEVISRRHLQTELKNDFNSLPPGIVGLIQPHGIISMAIHSRRVVVSYKH